MRWIGDLHNPEDAERFSSYLESLGIPHRIDPVLNKDWGSEGYGSAEFQVWILDEDQTDRAALELKAFLSDPYDPKYQKIPPPPKKAERSASSAPQKRAGGLTLYLVALCAFLFLWGAMTRPPITNILSQLPYASLTMPAVYKPLLFDYPKTYEELDRVMEIYSIRSLSNLNELPLSGQFALKKALQTPYWRGVYPLLVDFLEGRELQPLPPLFEKISQGQLWRLFSPALLHNDIFHLLFNMLWLFVLGQQMEARFSRSKFLLFLLLTGVLSNCVQYLMSGPNFLGFSGILCAMIAFVKTRQIRAPWEGYDLHPTTFILVAGFVLVMALISLLAFFFELLLDSSIPLVIANAAHLSGALAGWLLGRTELFQSE